MANRRRRTAQTPAMERWLREQAQPDTVLRAVRQARGLLQCQASEQFNVTESSWSRYESGKKRPPHGLLQRVAREWDCPAVLLDCGDVAAFVSMVAGRDGNVVDLEAWRVRRLPRIRVQVEWPDTDEDRGPAGPGAVVPLRRAA